MADAVVARLEAVAARLESAVSNLRAGSGAAAGGSGSEEKLAPQIVAYDALYQSFVQPLIDTSSKLGLQTISTGYQTAFRTQRNLFVAATQCKKPTQAELMKFVDPIVQVVNKAQSCDNRSPQFSHHKTFAETIQLMNWIFQPGPVAVVKATLEAADFYLIKILTSAKDAPSEDEKKNHRAYVQQTKDLINNFADFVKEYYLTGIIWNVKGKSITEFQPNAPASGGAAPPAPPVPVGVPPPPPVNTSFQLDLTEAAPPAAPKPTGGLGAVFAEINSKGESGVTTGLKKVTADMKTKNLKDLPTLQPKHGAPSTSASAPARREETKKEPSITLKQGTWFCENYENTQVEIPDVQMKQSVYIIKAKNAVITVPTKCKSIQVDNCSKTSVVFSSVVSTFEVVNSKSITVQIQGQCPSVTIDKTAGCSVILTVESIKQPPNIVSSLASELNVVVPGATPEDDPIELAVPQQLVTSIKNGKELATEALLHKG